MSAATLLKSLGLPAPAEFPKTEAPFDIDVDLLDSGAGRWTIRRDGNEWTLESKVSLSRADLLNVSHIVARMAPPGSVARLQADAHAAGTVYVGLVLDFDGRRIPVGLVSGDIGCGLTLVPLVTGGGRHLSLSPAAQAREFHSYVLACMRRSLKRGKIAEKGLTANDFLEQASKFYGDDELGDWLAEMRYVLDSVGLDHGGDVLGYISKFAQSLGSSGNHFMELSVDRHDKYWIVVHSGSRALGAMVYSAVAQACRACSDGFEIATGPLAEFYTRAYDALNKFAKLNRVTCAVAVLSDLGLATDAAVLLDAMRASDLFAPALAKCADAGAVLGLLGGLTHNGLKVFVNDADRQAFHVLSKGAIAVSRRGSSAIVALRAGEGCVAFTLADPGCPWREVSLAEAARLGYQTVHEAPGVVFAGHGAGRAQSTGTTERQSTFDDLFAFVESHGVVANIAPGVLGDNPAIAYKPSSEILCHLPLDDACTWSMLRTCVAHKEGLTYKKPIVQACAEYITKTEYDRDPLLALWHDLNLVKGVLPPDEFDRRAAARDEVMASLEAKFKRG